MGFLRKFFSLQGRIGRLKFFLNLLLLCLMMMVFFIVGGILGMGALGTSFLSLLMGGFSLTSISLGIGSTLVIALLVYGYIIFVYMGYALMVKRAHDLRVATYKTTIYYLIVMIVPIALVILQIFFPIGDLLSTIVSRIISLGSLVVAIFCLFVKGTTGDNLYGSDPLVSATAPTSLVQQPNLPKYLGIKLLLALVVIFRAIYGSMRLASNMIGGQIDSGFTSGRDAESLSSESDETSSSTDTGAIQKGTLLLQESPEEPILLAQTQEVPLFPDYNYSNNAIYYYDEIISGADSVTFTVFDSFFGNNYAIDKNHLYYEGKIIADADGTNTIIANRNYIYYANHIYYDDELMPDVDPQTFTIFDYQYSLDKNNVYYKSEILSGADLASFSVLENATWEYQAYDVNQKYYDGE